MKHCQMIDTFMKLRAGPRYLSVMTSLKKTLDGFTKSDLTFN